MKYTFWSPVHGRPGTTANLLSIALYIALKEEKESMITQTNFSMNHLELPLIGENFHNEDIFQDTGIDSLSRSIKAAPLDKETINNASYTLLPKLNLLPGTTKNNRDFFESDIDKVIINIIASVEKFYELVFVDTNSGQNSISQKALRTSDLIIVNLSQNKKVIDDFFNDYNFDPKKVFYIIGNYDRRSKNNLRNIRHQYRKHINSNNSAVIPYNTEFMDALSDGNLIDFMKKNINANKDSKNGYFMENVSLAAEKILKKSK